MRWLPILSARLLAPSKNIAELIQIWHNGKLRKNFVKERFRIPNTGSNLSHPIGFQIPIRRSG